MQEIKNTSPSDDAFNQGEHLLSDDVIHLIVEDLAEHGLHDSIVDDLVVSKGFDKAMLFDTGLQTSVGRVVFEHGCEMYGLDPKRTTSKALIKAAHDKARFADACRDHGLDPKRASQQDLDEAVNRRIFAAACRHHGLDPETATEDDLRLVVERDRFSNVLRLYGFDLEQERVTADNLVDVLKRRSYAVYESRYGIDLSMTSDPHMRRHIEQWMFEVECGLMGLDHKSVDERQLEEAIRARFQELFG